MLVDNRLAQVAQRRHANPRLPENQDGAYCCIHHPFGYDPNYAVTGVDMDHPSAAALLNISHQDAVLKQRMPTIMDFNFLPDMGRMNGNLLWVAIMRSCKLCGVFHRR